MISEPPVALRNAIRQMAAEARREAALLALSDPEHAFYSGVVAATDDRLHPEAVGIHDEVWLGHQAPPFREGYLKAVHVMTGFSPDAGRLMLPHPDVTPSR